MKKKLFDALFTSMLLLFATSVFATHIGGVVYCDDNRDGLIDAGDTPLLGVGVNLFGPNNLSSLIDSQLTGTQGYLPDGYFFRYETDPSPILTDSDYRETLDESTLPSDAIFIDPSTNNLEFHLNVYTDTADWLIDSEVCRDELPYCGDGIVDEGEECDDGNNDDGDGCSANCTLEPWCGNGILEDGEACDDGNNIDGDGCSAQCTIEAFCGDGELDPGEQCDDGNNVDGDGCSSSCTFEPFCGDGNLDPGEQCDDGNNDDGDGCSAQCAFEVVGGEGCTPGYWKQPHHFDSWVGYTPDTLFADVFEDAFPGMSLRAVARKGGGGLKALGRHTVAALLNAASPDVSYDRTEDQIISAFNDIYPDGEYEDLKDVLEEFNELGCPLN